jgi:hypothetical protein
MNKSMSFGLLISLTMFSLTMFTSSKAQAVPVLELDCRIDNSVMSSVPRKVSLRDGMIETIDCQSHATCKKSIYEVTMNYNSLYEYVIVSVTDLETKKAFSTEHTLIPNKTADSINNAVLSLGYGDVVTSMNDVPELDKKGRFFRISCERLN